MSFLRSSVNLCSSVALCGMRAMSLNPFFPRRKGGCALPPRDVFAKPVHIVHSVHPVHKVAHGVPPCFPTFPEAQARGRSAPSEKRVLKTRGRYFFEK